MPAALLVGIIIVAMFVPAAEKLFFQIIPSQIAAVQDKEMQLVESVDVLHTVRSVTSGEWSLREVFPERTVATGIPEIIPTEELASASYVISYVPATAPTLPVAQAAAQLAQVSAYEVPSVSRQQYQAPVPRTVTGTSRSGDTMDDMMEFLTGIWESVLAIIWSIVPYSVLVITVFGASIAYYSLKMKDLEARRHQRLYADPLPVSLGGGKIAASKATATLPEAPRSKNRWEGVMNHALSESPNDWRLAILDADIMLDEALSAQGYQGETVAEKLKQINGNTFRTLELAWEAHKIRNKVAHEGTQGALDHDETRRVIGLYQRVFEELKFI